MNVLLHGVAVAREALTLQVRVRLDGGATNNISFIHNMELKIKRLSEEAILPIRAHKSDAGIDLTCTRITQEINECGQLILVYHTDLAMEIPEGYVGLLFPRSSISNKSLAVTNSVGVIDSGYRGEIMAKMRATTDVVPAIYKPGERFAQLVLVQIPDVSISEIAELSESDRGEGGFGSTDISAGNATESLPETKDESINSQESNPAAVTEA